MLAAGAAILAEGFTQSLSFRQRDGHAALTTASAEMKWRNDFSLAGTFEGEFSGTRSYAGKGVARTTW